MYMYVQYNAINIPSYNLISQTATLYIILYMYSDTQRVVALSVSTEEI